MDNIYGRTIEAQEEARHGGGLGDEDLRCRESFTKFGFWMAGLSLIILWGIALLCHSTGLKKKGGSIHTLFILCCAMVLGMLLCSCSMLLVIFMHCSPVPIIGRKTEIFLKCMRIATLLLIFPVLAIGFVIVLLILQQQRL